MPKAKRETLTERGAVWKAIVAGVKDQVTNRVSAIIVPGADKPALQGFIKNHAAPGATVYNEVHGSYEGMPFDHEAVTYSVSEYVQGTVHTNGMESFWALLKHGYTGTFHHLSGKDLNHNVTEFAARHNVRKRDAIDRMAGVASGVVGKQLI